MRPILAHYLAEPVILLSCLLFSYASGEIPFDTSTLLEKMEMAYAGVIDYQATVEIRTYQTDGSYATQRFIYTFKKPKRIRLDFESPHRGMVLAYPDKNGKVLMRLPGPVQFLKFHLAPDSPLLMLPSGQHIDQTDLGLLIENISHSFTGRRRGPIEVAEENRTLRIRVSADNHFRQGVVTLYQFFIDEKSWLPVRVEELSPDGDPERTVTFQDLRTNIGAPESYFELDGG